MRQQQEDGDDASCENARGSQALLPPAQRLQIVCMSATLPGPGSFAKCLGARCYITDFRPIALNHFLVRVRQGVSVDCGRIAASSVEHCCAFSLQVCGGQVEDNTGKVVRRVPQLDKGKVSRLFGRRVQRWRAIKGGHPQRLPATVLQDPLCIATLCQEAVDERRKGEWRLELIGEAADRCLLPDSQV